MRICSPSPPAFLRPGTPGGGGLPGTPAHAHTQQHYTGAGATGVALPALTEALLFMSTLEDSGLGVEGRRKWMRSPRSSGS